MKKTNLCISGHDFGGDSVVTEEGCGLECRVDFEGDKVADEMEDLSAAVKDADKAVTEGVLLVTL